MSVVAIKGKVGVIDEFRDSSAFICVQKLTRHHLKFSDPENYQILWLEDGVGSIDADYEKRESFPFTILFIYPGKKVTLRFNCFQPKGWIIKFSRLFFRQHMEGFNIQRADIFFSGEIPGMVLSPKIGERINSLAEMINEIMQSNIPNKKVASSSLLKSLLIYCDSKCNLQITAKSNNYYLNIVSRFKYLVSKNLDNSHRVSDYAELLHISPKYLNKIVKEVMGVTAKSIISEQLLIRSTRELKFTNSSVKMISSQLGFSEPEHFSNFFKKNVGCTPLTYRKR
jgi:AraC family transcriptional regulator, transcriptional activator of pobA